LALALAVSIGASVACAEDEKKNESAADPAGVFAGLDANKDGQLTADEIPAEKKVLFDRLLRVGDTDKDGRLSSKEFAAGLGDRPSEAKTSDAEGPAAAEYADRLFKRLDTNGDGKVVLDEVPEKRKPMFEAMLKRSGKPEGEGISPEEFARIIDRATDKEKPAKKPGKPDGAPPPARIFKQLDANADGKVTLDEVPEARRPMFEKLFKRAGKSEGEGLSREELIAALPGRPDKPDKPAPPEAGAMLRGGLFAAIDADGDHKLSSEEIAAASEAIKKLDRDGDGSITVRELLPKKGDN
jgi:Ca2+-binding EF-hand superfamily protein